MPNVPLATLSSSNSTHSWRISDVTRFIISPKPHNSAALTCTALHSACTQKWSIAARRTALLGLRAIMCRSTRHIPMRRALESTLRTQYGHLYPPHPHLHHPLHPLPHPQFHHQTSLQILLLIHHRPLLAQPHLLLPALVLLDHHIHHLRLLLPPRNPLPPHRPQGRPPLHQIHLP